MKAVLTCSRAKLTRAVNCRSINTDGRWLVDADGDIVDLFPIASFTIDEYDEVSEAGKARKQDIEINIRRDDVPQSLNEAYINYVIEVPGADKQYRYFGSREYPAKLSIKKDKYYATLSFSVTMPLI